MKYEIHRSTIKSGDVLAWSRNGFFAEIIRAFTLSEYSHVGIAWEYKDRKFVIEAVEPYVRIVPLSDKTPFYHIPINKPLSEEAEEFAFSKVGKAHYSILDAIKAYFGVKTNPDTYQCAELCKEILAHNGISIAGKDTPAALIDNLLKLGNPIYYID